MHECPQDSLDTAMADFARRLGVVEQRKDNSQDDAIADLTHRVAAVEQTGARSLSLAEGYSH